jgi:hypothetical protein
LEVSGIGQGVEELWAVGANVCEVVEVEGVIINDCTGIERMGVCVKVV